MAKDKKIQWHPAFYGAMHLEFMENKADLEFTEEVILNTLPLRVDMLIIKKSYSCLIQNEIGKIFRKYNFLEYKSPDDTLNYDTFLKGVAYIYLYKAGEAHVDELLLEEMSLSFIRERKPVKLFKRLEKENFTIEEKWSGIYYIIKEDYIKIQVIVVRELSQKNHIWLNSLSGKVGVEQATELIVTTQKLKDFDDKNYADSLWEVVATANRRIIQKVREDEAMCKALAEIMKPEIEAAFSNGFNNGFDNGFDDGFDDGKEEKGIRVFQNMIKDGMSRELAQRYAEISDQLVEKALAEI